jgi:hypothetical protein
LAESHADVVLSQLSQKVMRVLHTHLQQMGPTQAAKFMQYA